MISSCDFDFLLLQETKITAVMSSVDVLLSPSGKFARLVEKLKWGTKTLHGNDGTKNKQIPTKNRRSNKAKPHCHVGMT